MWRWISSKCIILLDCFWLLVYVFFLWNKGLIVMDFILVGRCSLLLDRCKIDICSMVFKKEI